VPKYIRRNHEDCPNRDCIHPSIYFHRDCDCQNNKSYLSVIIKNGRTKTNFLLYYLALSGPRMSDYDSNIVYLWFLLGRR
jgi:hypothetical protein